MRLPLLLRTPPLLVARAPGRARAWAHRQGYLQVARQFHNDNDDVARPFSASASTSTSAPHPAFVWHNNATSDDYHRISEDLSYFPRFLSDTQQRILLNAALDRLDRTSSYASRRKRLRLLKSTETDVDTSLSHIVDVGNFLPDEYYDFEQVSFTPYRPSALTPYRPPNASLSQDHFDRVIVKFREARITLEQWPDKENVLPILTQITSLLPPVPLQTHVLHLATKGHILPHIDNLQASGSFILGVSLGAPRILRLEKVVPSPSQHPDLVPLCDLLLEPGSIYIQK